LKKLVLFLLLGLILLFPITAMTASVTFDYTADNNVEAWYVTDVTQVGTVTVVASEDLTITDTGNWDEWKQSDSRTVSSLTVGSTYEVIWKVTDKNNYPTDIAGFLASISSADSISGNLLSSESWLVTTDTDWQNANWDPAISYGANDYQFTPWYRAELIGGIAGIDPAAEWIWTSDNVGNNDVFIKAEFTVNSVPVPAAFWLLGSGLVGLVGFRRRKKSS